MFKPVEKLIDLGEGRTITIETGKLAKQTDGSVLLKLGNTMLLATVVSAKEVTAETDFMPLSVEYREKFASAGRFPGGFHKREARPSDSEILVSRLIDRALRPLFPKDYHAETFVNVYLISADKDIMPDAMAGLAASTALTISDVPFHGPISEVRVARIDGNLVINPTYSQLEKADIDIIVAATIDNILMVEGEMNEVSEEDMIQAIGFAHEEIKKHCQAQIEFAEQIGVTKREYCHEENNEEILKLVKEKTYGLFYEAAKQSKHKKERAAAYEKIKNDFIEFLKQTLNTEELNKVMLKRYFHDVEREALRNLILNEGIRLDGRKTDEIRQIECEVNYLPATHGSALFTRGETQSLSTVTLGTKLDEKMIDNVLVKGSEKFVLHYNFPPFSTGDARPMRGLSRREIGHGNLALRALKKVMPADLPYAVRIESDILESNGSSSMATVCAGTLTLMDAGVKIKGIVSGIAMGLITDTTSGKYAVLSDILGDEDHLGDMDFKVAGTEKGITATQMDIKIEGLSFDILKKALEQARAGRMHILSIMKETIAVPREDYKPHVPRIVQLTISKDTIGAVIGPGGKVIQEIQKETNSTIIIEEVDNVGIVNVFSADKDSTNEAVRRILNVTFTLEEGKTYKGIVKQILDFGAIIEFVPGKEGLLHISELDWNRVNSVQDILQIGDETEIKVIEVDKRTGKARLSRRELIPLPEGMEPPVRHERPDRNDRNDRGDRRGGDRRSSDRRGRDRY